MKIKFREAEGLLKHKMLRNRVEEIQALWDTFTTASNSANTIGSSSTVNNSGGGFLRTSAGLIQTKLRGRATTVPSEIERGQNLSDKLMEAKFVGEITELQQKVSFYLYF